MESPINLIAAPKIWALLQRLQDQQLDQPQDFLTLNQQLRKTGIEPETANALTQQLELRQHGTKKFAGLANQMVFTRTGLEQATRFQVALLHAQRLAESNITSVADLGCGIGTESLAFATLGMSVLAIDLDHEATQCASINLREFPNTEVFQGDICQLSAEDLKKVQAIFLDPARRDNSGRKFNPNHWAPPWAKIVEMMQWQLQIGVKVAPGIEYSFLPDDYHTQWTSIDGQLVEAALWSPGISPEGAGRSAVVIKKGTVNTLQSSTPFAANSAPIEAACGPLNDYLFEPDPAVIRSGMIAYLADATSTTLINQKIAYLSGPNPIDSPFVTSFKVIDTTSLRPKAIKKRLRELGVGPVEVKKRGADIDPNLLQKHIQGEGGRPAVVIATRIGQTHRAIIATRE